MGSKAISISKFRAQCPILIYLYNYIYIIYINKIQQHKGGNSMSIWDAIIQGIVQGLTEFLPVSSSGHVSIVQHFTGTNIEGAQSFTLFLHFGTLIAVFIAYWNIIKDLIVEGCMMIRDLVLDLVTWLREIKTNFRKFGFAVFKKGCRKKKKYIKGDYIFKWRLSLMNENRRMVCMVILACACAILLFVPVFGGLGLESGGEAVKTLADISEYTSEDSNIIVEGICLLLTGALLLGSTRVANKRSESDTIGEVTQKPAIAMGLGQCIAALPGLSRSGTTTTLGMLCGVEKNKALQFSFIIGIPAVLASSVLELLGMEAADWQNLGGTMPVIVGVAVSAVVGVLSIIGLKWIVKNNKLHYFGYYCLAAGVVCIVVSIIEMAMGLSGTEFVAMLLGK